MTMDQRQQIEELVYRSSLALDEGDFKGFLRLCDDSFRYSVVAFSPEIRKEMTWLDLDKAGMDTLFTNLPRHNSDHSPLARHVTVYTVAGSGDRADVVSALQVFRTTLDGGGTGLFAVGRYHDTVALGVGGPSLLKRVVRMVTREMGAGYHIPL